MTQTTVPEVGPGTRGCRRRRAWTTALLDNHAFRLDQIAHLQADLEPDDRSARAEVSRALLAAAQSSLQATQDALDRLAAGTYGLCTVCDRAIELQLLDALPMADRCSSCLDHLDPGEDLGEQPWWAHSLLFASGPVEMADLVSRS